jgi:transposase-like protein
MARKPSSKKPRGEGNGEEPKPEKPQLPDVFRQIERCGGDPDAVRTVGRPTDYTEEAGARLIQAMTQGYSITAAAGVLGVHRDTIYEWAERHPEFSDALKKGKARRVFKLETDLLHTTDGPTVTARIFALKNAAPEEWREKLTVEKRTDPDDPFLAFLKQISGRTLQPVDDPPPPMIDITPGRVLPDDTESVTSALIWDGDGDSEFPPEA